jgi:hypothetical protein
METKSFKYISQIVSANVYGNANGNFYRKSYNVIIKIGSQLD